MEHWVHSGKVCEEHNKKNIKHLSNNTSMATTLHGQLDNLIEMSPIYGIMHAVSGETIVQIVSETLGMVL